MIEPTWRQMLPIFFTMFLLCDLFSCTQRKSDSISLFACYIAGSQQDMTATTCSRLIHLNIRKHIQCIKQCVLIEEFILLNMFLAFVCLYSNICDCVFCLFIVLIFSVNLNSLPFLAVPVYIFSMDQIWYGKT